MQSIFFPPKQSFTNIQDNTSVCPITAQATHWIIHERLDAANDRRVNGTLRHVKVHTLKELQQSGDAVQLYKPHHKPKWTAREMIWFLHKHLVHCLE